MSPQTAGWRPLSLSLPWELACSHSLLPRRTGFHLDPLSEGAQVLFSSVPSPSVSCSPWTTTPNVSSAQQCFLINIASRVQGLLVGTISIFLPATCHTLFPKGGRKITSPGPSSIFLLKQLTSTHTMPFSLFILWSSFLLYLRRPRFDCWVGRPLEKGMATHF